MCASPVLAPSPFPPCRALCSSSCFALVSPSPLSLLQGVVHKAEWRPTEYRYFPSGALRPRATGPMLSSLPVSTLALLCSPHTTRPPVPLPSWPRLTPTLGPSSYPSFRLRCLLPSHPMLPRHPCQDRNALALSLIDEPFAPALCEALPAPDPTLLAAMSLHQQVDMFTGELPPGPHARHPCDPPWLPRCSKGLEAAPFYKLFNKDGMFLQDVACHFISAAAAFGKTLGESTSGEIWKTFDEALIKYRYTLSCLAASPLPFLLHRISPS